MIKNNKKKKITDSTKDFKFDVKTELLTQAPLMERLSNFRILPVTVVAFIAIVSSLVISAKYASDLDTNRQKIAHIAALKQLSERIEKSALQARLASPGAFEELQASEKSIDQLLQVLKNGGKINNTNTEIDAMDTNLVQFDKVLREWKENKPLLDALIAQGDHLKSLKKNVDKEMQNIQALTDASSAFQKRALIIDPKDIEYSQELLLLSYRIEQGLNNLFGGETFSLENGYSLVKDMRTFNSILQMFENGSYVYGVQRVTDPELLARLNVVKATYAPFNSLIEPIVSQVSTLNNAKDVALQVSNASRDLVETSGELDSRFTDLINWLNWYRLLSLALMVIGVLSLSLLVMVFYEKDKRSRRLGKALSKNQNNQEAVNMLLSQMEPMDNGDFGKRVYVADKFVTQIANKIDKTREIFSDIVKQIKTTSFQISQTADSTDNNSKKLLEVSNKQAQQMNTLAEKLGAVAAEMDEVAQTTWLAQEDANETKEASQHGENLVFQSIEKMNEIKHNIQESSKKIKKSSESAQAITEVTGLIRTITKKIEIIAVNAAIKAAAAGDAGREFTVVAQEVQRLAFDSKQATQNVLEMIKDVQSDIGAAVASMEITTQEVVEGAKMTENAGQALKSIELLSTQVAEKIAQASEKIEEKSQDMVKMSMEVKELQETTQESQHIIDVTAHQVDALKKISTKMSETVYAYKVDDKH